MKKEKSILFFYKVLTLIISLTILLISAYNGSTRWTFYSVFLLWFINTIYTIEDIHNRAALFVFQLTFFNFLLGGTLVNYLTNDFELYFFPDEILIHTYITLYLSQFSIFFVYLFVEKKAGLLKSTKSEKNLIRYIRQASIVIMGVTYFPYLWEIYDKVHFVSNNSYAEIYLRESTNLPGVAVKLAQCFAPAFYVYLGTLPKKKHAMLPILLFLAASTLSVMVGARADFARSIMIIFFYFLARDKFSGTQEKRWIGKKEFILLAIAVPLLILFLFNVGQSRWQNQTTSDEQNSNLIKDFMIEQGVSISVIHYSKYFEDELPNNMYVTGPLLKLVQENPLVKKVFETPSYKKQTVESALYSDRFGDAISYLAMPGRYVLGHGMGSSYIAETYHSLGYLGLIIINSFYGYALFYIDRLFGRNTFITAFSMLMLYRLMYAPRAATSEFISNTFNITHFAVMFGIIIIANILNGLSRRSKETSRNRGNEIWQ